MKIKGILQIVAALAVLGILYFLIPWSIGFGGFFGWIVLLAGIPPILAVALFLLVGGVTSCRR
ncbi:hypothetical protein [Puniceicoccus vermicola]|uniref:Uncharacterized protein n=1 Tax=Puniceicoccus vermicola TaxID=388746 RepID=A0A7X1AX55_9BACT|nr:hypothetical protein [Puniceicoccus vermicola]MBC2600643.1 hypothetical protein [Puniceicoccus vermicola]